MKKIILAGVILLILSGVGYMGNSILKNVELKKKLIDLTPMPEFNFKTLEGTDFHKSDLVKDMPVLIIYFNPNCDECQSETKQLVKHIDLFKNAQILMVTPVENELAEEFSEHFKLGIYPQIKILQDERDDFFQTFGSAIFPSTFAYNKYHTLAGYYKGGAKMELLQKVMNADL